MRICAKDGVAKTQKFEIRVELVVVLRIRGNVSNSLDGEGGSTDASVVQELQRRRTEHRARIRNKRLIFQSPPK